MTLVALTGWGQESDRSRSRDAGFDSHLVKPVDLDVLIAMLARLPVHTSEGDKEPGKPRSTPAPPQTPP
jgi:DNA-binding response OmpR family regulator